MDGFEKVLFQHLDEEVESLKGKLSHVTSLSIRRS